MKKYKGYYIDNICFKSKKDIDEFIKSQAIDRYKQLSKQQFNINRTIN